MVLAIVSSWTGCSQQPDARLAEFQKQGYAVSFKEFQTKYGTPDKIDPRSESFNAKLKNMIIVASLGTNYFSLVHLFRASTPPSDQDRQIISQFLAANRTNLDMLRGNIPGGQHRFPLDYSKGLELSLPHLGKLKALAQLSDFAAELDAETGSTESAVSNLVTSLELSRTLVNEPVFLSELVYFTQRTNTVFTLEYVLNRTPLTEGELASLRLAFEEDYNPRILDRGWNDELCTGLDIFEQVKAAQNSTNPAAVQDLLGGDNINKNFSIKSDFVFYLKTMSRILEAEKKQYPEKLTAIHTAKAEVEQTITSNNVLSGIIIPDFERAVFREADCNAKQALALSALAIERYRPAHANQLPEKLSDLTPALLSSVPIDPFDGQPLRYKKLPKGYLIYSIGRDRKDDGGKEWDAKKETGDLTFTVER